MTAALLKGFMNLSWAIVLTFPGSSNSVVCSDSNYQMCTVHIIGSSKESSLLFHSYFLIFIPQKGTFKGFYFLNTWHIKKLFKDLFELFRQIRTKGGRKRKCTKTSWKTLGFLLINPRTLYPGIFTPGIFDPCIILGYPWSPGPGPYLCIMENLRKWKKKKKPRSIEYICKPKCYQTLCRNCCLYLF